MCSNVLYFANKHPKQKWVICHNFQLMCLFVCYLLYCTLKKCFCLYCMLIKALMALIMSQYCSHAVFLHMKGVEIIKIENKRQIHRTFCNCCFFFKKKQTWSSNWTRNTITKHKVVCKIQPTFTYLFIE